MKKLEVDKSEIIYLGDNLSDLEASKYAQIDFVGVVQAGLDKEFIKSSLKSEGAETILTNVNDILKVIS